jgi:DNA-binding transcriptional LysR family regulator
MAYKYIDMRQLEIFMAAARMGSFSKAADKLGMTQPAVSLQMRALEELLGNVRLFDRAGGKKLSLTADGKTLMELAPSIINDFNSLPRRFAELHKKAVPVRIVTHSSVMTCLLPNVIKEFRGRFPECQLSIANRPKTDIVAMVRSGDADIGIASPPRRSPDIMYQPIMKLKRLLVMPKDHLLADQKRIGLKDIAGCPLILPLPGSSTRAVLERTLAGMDLKISMEVTGRDAVKEYVKMGMGITVLNEYYLTEADRKDFALKDVSDHFGQAERGILTIKGRYLSLPARELIKTIVQQFK